MLRCSMMQLWRRSARGHSLPHLVAVGPPALQQQFLMGSCSTRFWEHDEGTDGVSSIGDGNRGERSQRELLYSRRLHFRFAKELFQLCLVLFIHEFPLSPQVARLFFPNVVLSSGKFAVLSPGPGISTCAVMAIFTPVSSLTLTSPWLTPARY